MPQNAKFTAFTVSEFFMENQEGGEGGRGVKIPLTILGLNDTHSISDIKILRTELEPRFLWWEIGASSIHFRLKPLLNLDKL